MVYVAPTSWATLTRAVPIVIKDIWNLFFKKFDVSPNSLRLLVFQTLSVAPWKTFQAGVSDAGLH